MHLVCHFLFFNCSNRRVRSSKSISPPSGGPSGACPGGGPAAKFVLGTGGKSKLSEGGRGGKLTTPGWGAVGWRGAELCQGVK